MSTLIVQKQRISPAEPNRTVNSCLRNGAVMNILPQRAEALQAATNVGLGLPESGVTGS
jgi:hypothetical protein